MNLLPNFMRLPAAMLLVLVCTQGVAANYVDLRRIEPVHGDAAAGASRAVVCVACHGPNGNAVVPTFPKLAGQRADYIYHRLVEYRNADPNAPYYVASPMPAQAQTLSDVDMRNLAAYFAAQTPTASPTITETGDEQGATLYSSGDPAKGVPPCQGCHGADANGPIITASRYLAYPMLRGQHAAYLVSRLNGYRDKQAHDSTNDFIMRGVAHMLDDGSIHAVAVWLDSLPVVDKH